MGLVELAELLEVAIKAGEVRGPRRPVLEHAELVHLVVAVEDDLQHRLVDDVDLFLPAFGLGDLYLACPVEGLHQRCLAECAIPLGLHQLGEHHIPEHPRPQLVLDGIQLGGAARVLNTEQLAGALHAAQELNEEHQLIDCWFKTLLSIQRRGLHLGDGSGGRDSQGKDRQTGGDQHRRDRERPYSHVFTSREWVGEERSVAGLGIRFQRFAMI